MTRKGGQDHPHKKGIIHVGTSSKELPALSIQCFENRHGDCKGSCEPFQPEDCECSCHKKVRK